MRVTPACRSMVCPRHARGPPCDTSVFSLEHGLRGPTWIATRGTPPRPIHHHSPPWRRTTCVYQGSARCHGPKIGWYALRTPRRTRRDSCDCGCVSDWSSAAAISLSCCAGTVNRGCAPCCSGCLRRLNHCCRCSCVCWSGGSIDDTRGRHGFSACDAWRRSTRGQSARWRGRVDWGRRESRSKQHGGTRCVPLCGAHAAVEK